MKKLLNFSLLLSVITLPIYSVSSEKIERNVQKACQQIGDSFKTVGAKISNNSTKIARKTSEGVERASDLANHTADRVSSDLETAAKTSKIKVRKNARRTSQNIKNASDAIKNTAQDIADDVEYNYLVAKNKSKRSSR